VLLLSSVVFLTEIQVGSAHSRQRLLRKQLLLGFSQVLAPESSPVLCLGFFLGMYSDFGSEFSPGLFPEYQLAHGIFSHFFQSDLLNLKTIYRHVSPFVAVLIVLMAHSEFRRRLLPKRVFQVTALVPNSRAKTGGLSWSK
jgi:hypothetical protein